MRELTNTINYNGKDYDVVFNLNAMEAIQEEYKTIEAWGELTDGKSGETNIKALIFGFTEMINEGIEIKNEKTGANDPLLTKKQVARMISEIGLNKVVEQMNKTVIESTKVDDSKNE